MAFYVPSSAAAAAAAAVVFSDEVFGAKQVSDRQLLRVAQKLGAEWESLAIHMGFTQADVYKFKCDHPHSAEQQILAMLTAWRHREGRKATPRNLKQVLRDAGVDYDAVSSLDVYGFSQILDPIDRSGQYKIEEG